MRKSALIFISPPDTLYIPSDITKFIDYNFTKVMSNIYDTIIIVGGPAGVSKGVYVARKQIKAFKYSGKTTA